MPKPSTYSIIILPEVYEDLGRIDEFYRVIGSELAEKAITSIAKVVETLGDEPGPYRYPRFMPEENYDLREAYAPFGKEGFFVRYRIDDNRMELVVYRVHHARENRSASQ
ncbi:MAG: type II toxin-antitoxin system RelE/ParE family toxin [Aquisalinus sp.]|nr:type II toxin-antitoxin system RelE/ParE family toxin [Aquisalinus sp.]